MSKKTRRRNAPQAVAGQPPVPASPPAPRRRFPWKWIVLLTVGAALGAAAAVLFRDDRPWGSAPPGMVWIPGGKFTMGTNDSNPRFFDARPEQEVEIDGFWMDETEVTNEQFATIVEDTPPQG